MEQIKQSIIMLVASLIFGLLGASLLQYNFTIMGAVCMIITGFLLGTLFGFVIALIDDGEENV